MNKNTKIAIKVLEAFQVILNKRETALDALVTNDVDSEEFFVPDTDNL